VRFLFADDSHSRVLFPIQVIPAKEIVESMVQEAVECMRMGQSKAKL
jgi:hypothetical protein